MSSVKVVTRIRPHSESEVLKGGTMITQFDTTGKSVVVDGEKKAAFTFDRVFSPDSTQQEVFEYAAKPILEDLFRGYNGTIFAYGQTGSGKTHTMDGPSVDGPDRGLIPRIVFNMFQYIEDSPETIEFTVKCSYFEIYMEKIRDLLCDGNDNLQIHENAERGVYVRHATELFMQSPEEVMEVMRAGTERRSVASTNMNAQSSRSHSVFLMELSQKDSIKGGCRTGKLYLVDLAGSEKVAKTGAVDETLEEAKLINKSLSMLGHVIMNLTSGQPNQHIPYRDSKLTRILQDSLGGNCRTTIVICASPSSYNEAETLSSLRFGQRAKRIKNNAVVNVQYSAEELKIQLDAVKKDNRLLARKLAAADAELRVWRAGGTVNEEDRAILQNMDNDDGPLIPVGSSEEGAVPVKQPQAGSISEEEKKELMQRETELLDLIDDQQEQLRQMKIEVETLSHDRITISKLAAENAMLNEKIRDLQERIDEIMGENADYELHIEELARSNEELEAKGESTAAEKDRLLVELAAKHNASVVAIAELVAGLYQEEGSPQFGETGTVVDNQYTKARAYIAQLRNEISSLVKAKTSLDTTKGKLEKANTDLEKDLNVARLAAGEADARYSGASARAEMAEREIKQLTEKIASAQTQIHDLMSKLTLAEEKLLHTKEAADGEISKGQAQVDEMKTLIDKQQNLLKDEYDKEIAALKEQILSEIQQKQDLEMAKSQLSVEHAQSKTEIEKLKEKLSETDVKIQELQVEVERKNQTIQATSTITQATKAQTEAVQTMADKYKKDLASKLQERFGALMPSLGASGGPGLLPSLSAIKPPSEDQSKHVAYLEKVIKELTQSNQDITKQNNALQKDAAVLDNKLQAKSERVKNLETMLNEKETKVLQLSQEYDRLKNSTAHAKPVLRKKQSLRGGAHQQERRVLNGGGGGNGSNASLQQRPISNLGIPVREAENTNRKSTVSVSDMQSTMTPVAPVNPLDVEFV